MYADSSANPVVAELTSRLARALEIEESLAQETASARIEMPGLVARFDSLSRVIDRVVRDTSTISTEVAVLRAEAADFADDFKKLFNADGSSRV